MQGELDWVVMKALEKDRTRRYETANGFARDIQRYLADEVVEARPPSGGYRLKKFVKRNKGQVIAASLLLLTLLAGIVGTSLGMWEANRARVAERKRADGERNAKIDAQQARDAEAKQRAVADDQRDKAIASEIKARDEAAKAQAINDFLTQDLLTQAEPANNAVEDKVTLLEVLDRAAEKVGTRFAGQPELERSLRATIATPTTAWRRGKRPNCNGELCSKQRGSAIPSRPTPTKLKAFSRTFFATAVDGTPRSWRWPRRPPGTRTHSRHRQPRTLRTLDNLGLVYLEAGKLPEAIAVSERVRDAQIAKLGPDHPDTLTTLNNLARAYQAAGRLPEAIALLRARPRRSDRQARARPPRHSGHAQQPRRGVPRVRQKQLDKADRPARGRR